MCIKSKSILTQMALHILELQNNNKLFSNVFDCFVRTASKYSIPS